MKFKVGDKVRIKSKDWYEKNRNFGRYIGLPLDDFNYLMAKHCGEIATITEILEDSVYKIDIDKDNFNWTDKMFEEDFDFKQLKVGETFSINGKTYLVEEKTGCTKCAFFGNSCGNVSLPYCSLMIREDYKNVIFTEIKKQKIMKEKKVVKFSIDLENQTVTLYDGYNETVLSKNELDALFAVRNLLFKEDADNEK